MALLPCEASHHQRCIARVSSFIGRFGMSGDDVDDDCDDRARASRRSSLSWSALSLPRSGESFRWRQGSVWECTFPPTLQYCLCISWICGRDDEVGMIKGSMDIIIHSSKGHPRKHQQPSSIHHHGLSSLVMISWRTSSKLGFGGGFVRSSALLPAFSFRHLTTSQICDLPAV